ncbi:hypothetical protein ACKXGF_04760 [Alkalibacillus sp. S2W]|uniref:hypothetical protein n=1 Tax=Alkalibacillus sp. S2W TaxID=3386553 RepID=UPI00398C9E06
MLTNILWGLFLVAAIALMIILDKRKQKKRYTKPHHLKTQQEKENEKEVEREVEKARSRRNGPPAGGGPGGF